MKNQLIEPASIQPIYRQIADYLRRQIIAGQPASGARLPTEAMLTGQLGASRMTVRKALKLLEQQNLIVQKQGKGTFVTFARKPPAGTHVALLKLQRAGNFAQAPYETLLYSGVLDTLAGLHCAGTVVPEVDRSWLAQLHQSSYAGVIIYSPTEADIPFLEAVREKNVPLVILGASFPGFRKRAFSLVDIDHRAGARQAVAYLIARGHRQIAYLSKPSLHCVYQQRVQGYHDALQQAGIKGHPAWIISEPGSAESICQAVRARLGAQPEITALFAAGYMFAFNAYAALKQAGLTIPGRVSVAGYDDYQICEYFQPPLTTVRQPVYEMARLAITILVQQIQTGKVTVRQEMLMPELIVRQSVKNLSVQIRKYYDE